MALTNSGLPNGGVTPHYSIQYDDTLPVAQGLHNAQNLYKHCEVDFVLMKSWFGGIDLQFAYPLPVNINTGSGGASWTCPPEIDLDTSSQSPAISINAGGGATATLVRYLLVSEVTEMFMFSQNGGWYEPDGFFQNSDEGSMGEGLSRFLGTQFLLVSNLGQGPQPGYAVTHKWLNSHPRQNYIDSNPDDNQSDAITGCTTLFMYYLNSQLDYGVDQIIANSASNLSGVYKNLTGQPDGWTPFINLVNLHFPPGVTYHPPTDNLFPAPDLWQFYAPNPITFGYKDDSAEILLDNPAPAEVIIHLKSENEAVATVPATITISPGASSINVPITAKLYSATTAVKSTKVKATYAGRTLKVDVDTGPPALAGFTISARSVEFGADVTATLTLNQASKHGAVAVEVVGDQGFDGIQTPVEIPQGHANHQFTITPAINDPYLVVQDEIYATLGSTSLSASLTIRSSIVVGVLYSVAAQASILGGTSLYGSVYLESAVPTDTLVGLMAIEAGAVSPLPPHSSPPSAVVIVPPSVTVPAGQNHAGFLIKTLKPTPPNLSVGAVIVASAGIKKYVNITVYS